MRRCIRRLFAVIVLCAVAAVDSGDTAGAGAAAVGRGLELPLRNLSAWLVDGAPLAVQRKAVTIGLRN